jgi:hypothetical protein
MLTHMNISSRSALDREVVALTAIWDLIGSMVHYSHFEKGHATNEATLMFRNREASRLFLIMLADFLSPPNAGTFGLVKGTQGGSLGSTHLTLLEMIATNPRLGHDSSLLAKPCLDFAAWLDGYSVIDAWLPSIKRDGPLTVQRVTFLKICGTVSKHGIARLGDIAGKVQAILMQNGTQVSLGEAYLVIPEFREWFEDTVFAYHASSIACLLNDIRWGIFNYLRPEFQRAYRPEQAKNGLQMYGFDVPTDITDPLINSMYWDLMNNVRAEPYFPRFTVSPWFTKRY